jgi:salicylate hydroxylase
MRVSRRPSSASKTALIIGAGLGGLTTALALQRDGWRVRVCEQASALGDVGAGITLSPGAGRALCWLGVGKELLAASLPVPDIAFVHYRSGELLAGTVAPGPPPDRGFETPRHIHRADLHSILLRAVRSHDAAAVITGQRLVTVEEGDSGVVAGFAGAGAGAGSGADGGTADTTREAQLLIGADGVRSAVRAALFDDSPPQFAGQIAFRCLIPTVQAAPFMHGVNAAVSIGDARVFNRYLIRHATLVNVIGIARSERWQQEGWHTPATVTEFLQEFAGFHADILGLIRCAPSDNLIKWGLFVRPPLPRWSVERVVLVGDSAHPILPFLGLGAALAIEDAVVLSRALAQVPDLHGAFAAYQRARMQRVEAVRLGSIRQGEIIQASDPVGFDLRQSPSQDSAIFDYDPCAVSVQ